MSGISTWSCGTAWRRVGKKRFDFREHGHGVAWKAAGGDGRSVVCDDRRGRLGGCAGAHGWGGDSTRGGHDYAAGGDAAFGEESCREAGDVVAEHNGGGGAGGGGSV